MVQKRNNKRIKQITPDELIRLSRPIFKNVQELLTSLDEVLKDGYLVQGAYVSEFEEAVKNYLNVKHAIAVSSGTSALHLSLLALNIGPGDEVIVPALTFPATVNVVELVGATPVLVDVDIETYNIDLKKIEKSITSKTKAVIPVHLFGNPVDLDPLLDLANKYNLYVIEDAAGALGSEYNGKKCGTIGHVGCFSFHPRKIITTGEGGMVVTNDDSIAEKIRLLRNHGIKKTQNGYDFIIPGFNYRMNEIEALIGLYQIKDLETIIQNRQHYANLYISLLNDVKSVKFQKVSNNSNSVWQAFVIRIENYTADLIIKKSKKYGIETGIGTYAIHLLHYYKNKYHFSPSDYPNAYKLFNESVALPIYNYMKDDYIRITSRMIRRLI